MKHFVLALATFAALTACGQQSNNDNTNATAAPAANENIASSKPVVTDGVINVIGQDEFSQLVADWKNAADWKFLGTKPAIVDFNATWCGPCRKLEPILKELAKEYAGKIDFYSIDVDDNRELAKAFGISSIPMVLICPTDTTPQAIVGLYPKEEIVQAIQAVTKVTLE